MSELEAPLSELRALVAKVNYPLVFSDDSWSARKYQDADFFSEYFWFREGLEDGREGTPFDSVMSRPLKEAAYLRGLRIGRKVRDIREMRDE